MEKKELLEVAVDNMTEENKTALQSETWSQVREALSKENAKLGKKPQGERRETEHFTAEYTAENAYGASYTDAVRKYLILGYKAPTDEFEIDSMGSTYKVLRRPKVTVFYDDEGNTLFDVENERLEKEYKWFVTNKNSTDDAGLNDNTQAPSVKEATATKATGPEDATDVIDAEAKAKVPLVEKKEENYKYASGAEKIKAEAETEYKAAKDKEAKGVMKGQMAPIVEYITEKCEKDPDYNALIVHEHKTWKKCYDFMMKKAKAMAAAGSTGFLVEGKTILKWVDEYYQKDDKAEFEAEQKRAKDAADRRKKQAAEVAKKAEKEQKQAKPKAANTSLTAEKEKQDRQKSNGDNDGGQIDIFSMLDM